MIKNEQCNDSFCYNCWINYLKEKINTNILDKIPCMNYTCGKILSKKFIESLLKNNPSLLSKYEKFLDFVPIQIVIHTLKKKKIQNLSNVKKMVINFVINVLRIMNKK